MIQYSFNCDVINGKMVFPNREGFLETVRVLEGLPLEIIVKQRRTKKPSSKQRGYYWACMIPLVFDGLRDAGWSITDFPSVNSVHEFLKDKFCPREEIVNEDTGEALPLPPSTEKLDTRAREKYHEDIRQWAAEFLGIYIPEPLEQTTLNYEL